MPAAISASSEWVRSSRDRSGVRDQGDALAFQRLAQGGVCQQAVDTEFHGCSGGGSVSAKQAGAWKSGLPGGWASAQ